MSGYWTSINDVLDCIDRRYESARKKALTQRKKDREFIHFKNVIVSRLGSDPAVANVVRTWRTGKDPVNCKIQILGSKNWTIQQRTDIEQLYISFKRLNSELLDAEKKYGMNPRVLALIDSVRASSDVRLVPFEKSLQRILNKEEI